MARLDLDGVQIRLGGRTSLLNCRRSPVGGRGSDRRLLAGVAAGRRALFGRGEYISQLVGRNAWQVLDLGLAQALHRVAWRLQVNVGNDLDVRFRSAFDFLHFLAFLVE